MRKKVTALGNFFISIILATSMFFLAALSDLDSSMHKPVLLGRTYKIQPTRYFLMVHMYSSEDVEDNSSNNGCSVPTMG